MSEERRWPFQHEWEFGAFAGGWLARICKRCGVVGIGACWGERLFKPCRTRPSSLTNNQQREHR